MLAGCGEDSAKVAAPAVVPAKPPTKEFTDAKLLEFGMQITPSQDATPKYIVSWTAKVPTGGWKLVKETVQVEEKHRELRMASVYVTLIEPGPGDVVTQAQATLTDSHDCGELPVNGAELFVRRQMNGVTSEFAASYGNVARAGKQY